MAVIKSRGVAQVTPGNIGGGFLTPAASSKAFSEGAEDLKLLAGIGERAASTYIKVENARLKAEERAADAAAKKLAADAEKTVTEDYYIKYDTALREVETKYKNMPSQNSYENYQKAKNEIMELRKAFIDSLGTTGQEARFSVLARDATTKTINNLLQHQSAMVKKYQEDVRDASSANFIEGALHSMFKSDGTINYEQMASAEVDVRQNARAKYSREPEAIRYNHEREAAQAFHKRAVEKLYNEGKYQHIKPYMDAFGKMIDPSYRSEMNAKTDDALIDEYANGNAIKILSDIKDPNEQIEEARKIDDLKLQKKTISRINYLRKEYAAAREYKQDRLAESAAKDLFTNGTKSVKWMNVNLRAKDHKLLKAIYDDMVNGFFRDTKPEVYNEILGKKGMLEKVDLMKYKDRLSSKDLAQLQEWQYRLRNKDADEETKTEIKRSRTIHSQVNNYASTISNDKDKAAYINDMFEAIEAEKYRKGMSKKDSLSEEEVRAIHSMVTRDVVNVNTGWFNSTVPLYKLKLLGEEEFDESFEHRESWPDDLKDNPNAKYDKDNNRITLEDAVSVTYYDVLGRYIGKVDKGNLK